MLMKRSRYKRYVRFAFINDEKTQRPRHCPNLCHTCFHRYVCPKSLSA
ncbi:hypothetical protein MTBSS4_280030 [Magnetospirillum sp. SS-4]|nr:hypothetical protein MTBSS4_280030 [Magnetospirillum sp. SS-4]